MESASAVTYLRRHSITLGEQPTVFSLKSRRSFSARPPVGGEYGAILRTASRGSITRDLVIYAHLHGTRVRFQTLRACQRRNRRGKFRQALRRKLLHRNYL